MVARPVLIAGVAGLLVASSVAAGAALGSTATGHGRLSGVPPKAERIAATTAVYNAIEAKISGCATRTLPRRRTSSTTASTTSGKRGSTAPA